MAIKGHLVKKLLSELTHRHTHTHTHTRTIAPPRPLKWLVVTGKYETQSSLPHFARLQQ